MDGAGMPSAPLLDPAFDGRELDRDDASVVALFERETARARRDRVMLRRGFQRVACDCDAGCVCPQLRSCPTARCTIWKRLPQHSQPRSSRR